MVVELVDVREQHRCSTSSVLVRNAPFRLVSMRPASMIDTISSTFRRGIGAAPDVPEPVASTLYEAKTGDGSACDMFSSRSVIEGSNARRPCCARAVSAHRPTLRWPSTFRSSFGRTQSANRPIASSASRARPAIIWKV